MFPKRPEKAWGNTRGVATCTRRVRCRPSAACFPPCCYTYLSRCLGVYRKSESPFYSDYLIDTCSHLGSNQPSLDTSSDFALVRLIRLCKSPLAEGRRRLHLYLSVQRSHRVTICRGLTIEVEMVKPDYAETDRLCKSDDAHPCVRLGSDILIPHSSSSSAVAGALL